MVMGWQPIETAPKDGTRVLLWIVHCNAKYATSPFEEGWIGACIGSWSEHNGGGFTWYGIYGTPTHWRPLPAPPKETK